MTQPPEQPTILRELDPAAFDPPAGYPGYRSTQLRAPSRPFLSLPAGLSDRYGPVFGEGTVSPTDHDLTAQHPREPLGQRIVIAGTLLGTDGRPIPGQLVECWQANAAGRYAHPVDNHPAPLDPNFTGYGRALTDASGQYRFVTIRPGAYPWGNHHNAWRPAHVHFSVFGRAFTDRLVTQMYFPGDPLFALDPIFSSVADPAGRDAMISRFDLSLTEPQVALGFRFDIVVGPTSSSTPAASASRSSATPLEASRP